MHVILAAVAAYILFAGVGGGTGAAAGNPSCTLLASLPTIAPVACSAFTYFITTGAAPGCAAYFTSLEESLIHTFAMVTGAEFPTAMLPALACSRSVRALRSNFGLAKSSSAVARFTRLRC